MGLDTMKYLSKFPSNMYETKKDEFSDLKMEDKNSTIFTTHYVDPNTTMLPIKEHPCRWILYADIANSRVRIWDLCILIPNVIFLVFLLLKLKSAITKLRRTNTSIFFAFYGLVFAVSVISVLRCAVSMTVNASLPVGHYADKVLWLLLRFFLLATEMSVVIFGLAFGHLDSRTSIHRVLSITSFIALVYSVTQGVLEFKYPDDRFHVKGDDGEYDMFGHGGMLFWFISSIIFFVIYTTICFLPFTNVRERFALPTKKSFYWYSFSLAILNLIQAIGSGLLYFRVQHGMCVVDITTYAYFTLFTPLVYGTFLWNFFATTPLQNILFSYKAQVDDNAEEDSVSLPRTFQSPYKDPDPTMSNSYDSTHFDASSPNPLYGGDLSQFPINAELRFNSDYFSGEGGDAAAGNIQGSSGYGDYNIKV